MKSCAVFLADGFEEIEAVTVIDYLRRAQVMVPIIAAGGADTVVTGAHGLSVHVDLPLARYLAELNGALPDAAYIPGGMPGAANLAADTALCTFLTTCFAAGKIVAALCAAPAVVLSQTGILRGRRYTCYPGMERAGDSSSASAADAMQGSISVPDVPFVTDGNVVTGRGPGCAEQFAMELVRLLSGEDIMQRIKAESIQR
ncbi:MAG: DJ-1/PfpI family protein [Treponema sp.]|nr:DJ-1/PfpI family protein [Treponema sp.]